MVREVVLAILAVLLLAAPLAGAEPGQVVLSVLVAALAALALSSGHLAPRPLLTSGPRSGAPLPRRRDRAVDPVHHPDAARAPGRC